MIFSFMIVVWVFVVPGMISKLRSEKKLIKWRFIVSLICFLGIIVHIGALIISDMETISEEVVNKVCEIPWEDTEYLKQLGFTDKGDRLVYDEFKGWSEEGQASYFRIYVEKMDKNEAIKKYKLKYKNDVPMRMSKFEEFNNVFFEFLNYSNMNHRSYYFYLNGFLISASEYNEAGREKFFEPYIMSL